MEAEVEGDWSSFQPQKSETLMLHMVTKKQSDMFNSGIQKAIFTCDLHAEVILWFWFNALNLFDLSIIKILQVQSSAWPISEANRSTMVLLHYLVNKTVHLTYETEVSPQFILKLLSRMLTA